MAQRRDPNLFEVLIGQIGKDGKIDVVLCEALSVLRETKPLKPVDDPRGHALIGYAILAPLSAAVTASGFVNTEGNKKTVQHLEDGRRHAEQALYHCNVSILGWTMARVGLDLQVWRLIYQK